MFQSVGAPQCRQGRKIHIDGQHPSSAEAIYDRGAFLLLLATVALDLFVILRRRELWPAPAVLLCYLLPFLCVTAGVYGRFPDDTRVMIYFYTLAVMVLPWVVGRWRFGWIGAAGLASLGYLAGFLTEEVKTPPHPTVAAHGQVLPMNRLDQGTHNP